jgi:hypothetical protein
MFVVHRGGDKREEEMRHVRPETVASLVATARTVVVRAGSEEAVGPVILLALRAGVEVALEQAEEGDALVRALLRAQGESARGRHQLCSLACRFSPCSGAQVEAWTCGMSRLLKPVHVFLSS